MAFRYNEYEIDNLESRKYAIAFVLFVSKIWKRQNTKDDNKVIIEKWMKFRSSLIDLDFLIGELVEIMSMQLLLKEW